MWGERFIAISETLYMVYIDVGRVKDMKEPEGMISALRGI